jgi:signal transduction histidine kinase
MTEIIDKPLRILILEDRPSDADLMEFELREAGFIFVSKRVMTQDAFIRELEEFSQDLILSDYDLPQYTGFLALAEAKSKYPDVPFILVTGAIGEDRAIEILTHGAKDYVMKGHLHRLVPAVRRALAEAEEHKVRKQAEEVLEKCTSQLEELNRELESFSYSVSHDLRAPLRAIDGYARLILKKQGDKFDEDTLSKFNVIRNSTQMMGQLIDDLLTFSQLGRQHMSITKLDMDAMMREAWKELQVINPERSISLTVKDTPTGYGDRALIKQVCINLLSNAIKFTKYMDDAHIEIGGRTDRRRERVLRQG